MILTDLLNVEQKSTWTIAKECGVNTAVIKLPNENLDVTSESEMGAIFSQFISFGLTPIGLEPMPTKLHEHIKRGDDKRDESIDKIIKMFPILDKNNVRFICFNWMPYIGWFRTKSDIVERGGALVTEFNIKDFVPTNDSISANQLWDNYFYFIKAVLPYAEKFGIKLALHPDDPPLKLGNVDRIMINYSNIDKAINTVKSDFLGVTFCQANFKMMGEDLFDIIPKLKDKIMFVHFRNVVGDKFNFRETFHDNGSIDMAKILKLYMDCGIDVPIRVDHVPTLLNESAEIAGYGDNGRLFAIGYLKGLLEALYV